MYKMEDVQITAGVEVGVSCQHLPPPLSLVCLLTKLNCLHNIYHNHNLGTRGLVDRAFD